MLQFRRLSDHKEVDLKSYCAEVFSKQKDIRVYVGTDSQNHRGSTVFATVIVFHYGNHGGHVLFSKITKPRYRETQSRLWQEVMYSLDTAIGLRETAEVEVSFVDLDLNSDPKYKSNEILRAALGMIEAYGFETRIKGLGPYAAIMSDCLCR